MRKIWFEEAWEDYLYWQTQDKKTLKRINALIKDVERDPFAGIGKPEGLKYREAGLWSRRIDDTNRLVYRIRDGLLEIVSCRGQFCRNDKSSCKETGWFLKNFWLDITNFMAIIDFC